MRSLSDEFHEFLDVAEIELSSIIMSEMRRSEIVVDLIALIPKYLHVSDHAIAQHCVGRLRLARSIFLFVRHGAMVSYS